MSKKKVVLISGVALIVLILFILLTILIAKSKSMSNNNDNPTSAPVSSATSFKQQHISYSNSSLKSNLTYFFDPQDIYKTTLYSKNNDTGEVSRVLDLVPSQGNSIQSVSPSGKYIIIGRGAQYVGGIRFNIYDLETKQLVTNLIPAQMYSTWINNSTLLFEDSLSTCPTVNINGGQPNCERAEIAFSKLDLDTMKKEVLFQYQRKEGINGNVEELLNDGNGKIFIKIVEEHIVNGVNQILAHLSYSYDINTGEFTQID